MKAAACPEARRHICTTVETELAMLETPVKDTRTMTAVDRVMLYAVICYAVLGLTPIIGGLPPVAGTVVATLLFAVVSLALVVAAAQVQMRAWEEAYTTLGLGLCWHLLSLVALRGDIERAVAGPASSVLFLLACVGLGKFIARIVRERNLLLPVCLVAALADIYTVFWGPTGKALEYAPKLVEKLSVAIPKLGSASGTEGIAGLSFVAVMGLGDIIFAALFFAAAARFGLNLQRTFWGVLMAIVVGMFVVLFSPVGPLPLLPFIVVGFLLANHDAFVISAQERRSLLIAGAFLAIILATGIIAARLF